MTEHPATTSSRFEHPIVRIVGIVGDIASITGISLLWWKGTNAIVNFVEVVVVAVGVILGFGFLMLGIAATYETYMKLCRDPGKFFNWLWKTVYFSLVVPLFFLMLTYFAYLVIRGTMGGVESLLTGQDIRIIMRDRYGIEPKSSPVP